MNFFKFIIISFFLLFLSNAKAESNIAFIDIDFLIQNSNIGKITLKKIDAQNLKDTDILKKKEKDFRKKESEIKKKQNIVSKEELKKEVDKLKKDINNYNKEKQKVLNDLKKFKVNELNLLLSKFNDIINEYMEQNSIDIVLNKKNLYMGKTSSDITKKILEKINN